MALKGKVSAEAEALKAQLALKDSAVAEAVALKGKVSAEAEALKAQLDLKDKALKEALALKDTIAAEAEALKRRLAEEAESLKALLAQVLSLLALLVQNYWYKYRRRRPRAVQRCSLGYSLLAVLVQKYKYRALKRYSLRKRKRQTWPLLNWYESTFFTGTNVQLTP